MKRHGTRGNNGEFKRNAWIVGGLLLLLLLIPIAGCDDTEDVISELSFEGFAETVDGLREQLLIPALSAAVVKDGELLWSQGFGTADLENDIPATADTPYGLASVTKPFAAFLLMQQVEAGALDLDAPVSEFGIDLGNSEITVRHLLSHTSEGTPGSHYQYSGNRYAYLTGVIEQLYGQSFRSVLRSEILGPLDMTNTVLNAGGCGMAYFEATLAADDPERAFLGVYEASAVPYQYDPDYQVYPVSVPSYANAAAGLVSSVNDLAKFAAAIEDDILVTARTKTEMFRPTRLRFGGTGPYGLGWFTESYEGTDLIWHYGYGAYSSLFLMVPEEGWTFIVLANTQNLSRPFALGHEDVSVLASPMALAFIKQFVLEPRLDEPLPNIDWTASPDDIVSALHAVESEEVRALCEIELWSFRKLFAGVGNDAASQQLLQVDLQAYPRSERAAHDMYQVGRPGPRSVQIAQAALTSEQANRWNGHYGLRSEDHDVGLPLNIEIFASENEVIALAPDDSCRRLLIVDGMRLLDAENPQMCLRCVNQEDGNEIDVEFDGAIVARYVRVE